MILDQGKVVDFGSKEVLFKKYCGKSTITIENSKINEQLTKDLPKILAPDHLIAISCLSKDEELEIVKLLIDENINYKRSNNDIEIMSINAKAKFNGEVEGVE